MKIKQILTLLLIVTIGVSVNAQSLMKNSISVKVGKVFIDNFGSGESLRIGYKRHVVSGLYGVVGFSKQNGSNSLRDVIEGDVVFDTPRALGDHIVLGEIKRPNVDDGDVYLMPVELISTNTYYIGLLKHIQLGEKLILAGSIAFISTEINEQLIQGITYDDDNLLILQDVYPEYQSYRKLGAEVDLGIQYFLKDHVSVGVSANYLTSFRALGIQLGINAWF